MNEVDNFLAAMDKMNKASEKLLDVWQREVTPAMIAILDAIIAMTEGMGEGHDGQ